MPGGEGGEGGGLLKFRVDRRISRAPGLFILTGCWISEKEKGFGIVRVLVFPGIT